MLNVVGWFFPPKPKKLGPLDVRDVWEAERNTERLQNDVLPGQFFLEARTWILAGRPRPKIGPSRLGGLK